MIIWVTDIRIRNIAFNEGGIKLCERSYLKKGFKVLLEVLSFILPIILDHLGAKDREESDRKIIEELIDQKLNAIPVTYTVVKEDE